MEGEEGRLPRGREKALCPNPFASQHKEENGDVVQDAGGGGQASVCSRPCTGGLRAERTSILSYCASSGSPLLRKPWWEV